MLAAVEAREQYLALIDSRVIDPIAIHVGVDQEIRRLRDHDLTVDGGDTQWRSEAHILHKDRRLVGLAGARGVLEDDDAVAFLTATTLTAVVHALGDKHPALLVEVDVRWIEEHRRSRPDRDLKAFRHGEEFWRDEHWTIFYRDSLLFIRLLGKHQETDRSRTALTTAL